MQTRTPLLHSLLRRSLVAISFVLIFSATASAQDASSDDGGPLKKSSDVATSKAFDNDSIVRMTKAGLDEAIILQTIQMHPGQYDVSPDALIALKQAGVSSNVMAAMQARNSGFSTRAGSTVSAKGIVPAASLPVVDEVGVYYKDHKGVWQPLKTEKCVQRSGGWVKSTLTDNIIKQDLNGYVHGAHSPLFVPAGTQILIYTPSGVDGAEYDFIRFREKKDGREYRATTGGVFHSQSGADRDEVEFDPKKIAPQTYVFTIAQDQEKGEYGVLPPGITNSKVYTFSIKE